jgi:hypothetical protein
MINYIYLIIGQGNGNGVVLTSKIRQILKNDVLITAKKLMVMNDR